jgi:hypothetical protein
MSGASKLRNRSNSTHGGFWFAIVFAVGRGLFENNGSGDASMIGGGSMAGYESGVSGLTSMEEDT